MREGEQSHEVEMIDEVLGTNPRASQLRLMRASLEERRNAVRTELERTNEAPSRARLIGKIKTMDKQIAALRQEEGITEFVENSVRVAISKAALDEDE